MQNTVLMYLRPWIEYVSSKAFGKMQKLYRLLYRILPLILPDAIFHQYGPKILYSAHFLKQRNHNVHLYLGINIVLWPVSPIIPNLQPIRKAPIAICIYDIRIIILLGKSTPKYIPSIFFYFLIFC